MNKTSILGKAVATAEQMAAYLLSKNPTPKIKMEPVAFCRLFLYMGALEGVRGDVLFAQSCKETGNFKYKGTVKEGQNNYAGLGTTDADTPGATFPDEATGILAQAQHAKGYDGTALNFDCVDPRYEVLVKYKKIGTAQHWEELGGTWAVPGYDTKKYTSLQEAHDAHDSYGYQIVNIMNNILAMPTGDVEDDSTKSVSSEVEDTLPLAGMTFCLDAGHVGDNYNKCPTIPEYAESAVMWKLHLMKKRYLEEQGATVITTRADQFKDLNLVERGKKSEDCVLFTSDHSNAVSGGMNENIDHVAIYYLVDDNTTDCDDISKAIAEKLAPIIAEIMGTEDGYKVLTRKSANDRNGDGIMNDNYYAVLHGARLVGTPGLIIEHGFHTHTKTVQWLLNDDNLDRLARAEVECLVACFSNRETGSSAPAESKVRYKVQVGAYKGVQNAENTKAKLAAAGFDGFITKVGEWYKVQTGAFRAKENATALQNRLKAAGFSAIIVGV